ncbi:MAG: hypothetical protein AAB453_02225 [Patescibacteria group bacterium]
MLVRFLSYCLMFLTALFLPWWGVLAVGALGLILFNNFFEIIFAGFWFDLLYGSSALPVTTTFYLTFASLGMFTVINFFKRLIYLHARL